LLNKFSPDKLSKNERFLFYGVCIALTLFLLDHFAVQSIRQRGEQLDEEIEKQELLYKNRSILVANKQGIEKRFGEYDRYLQTKKGSDEDSLSDIFSYLESLARKNDLTLVDVKPKNENIESEYLVGYPIEVEVEANLNLLLNFFYELSEGVPIIDVKKVLIKVKNNLLETKMDVEAYAFKK